MCMWKDIFKHFFEPRRAVFLFNSTDIPSLLPSLRSPCFQRAEENGCCVFSTLSHPAISELTVLLRQAAKWKGTGSLSAGAGCREAAQQRRGLQGFLGERAGRPASDRGPSLLCPPPRRTCSSVGGMSHVRGLFRCVPREEHQTLW